MRNIKGKAERPAAKKPAARAATKKAAPRIAVVTKSAATRSSAAKASRTTEALDELRRETRALSLKADRLLERLG